MKIHAISVIKNEADIIAHNLTKAAKWAHKIYVLDNGSTDDCAIAYMYLDENMYVLQWMYIYLHLCSTVLFTEDG